jgi:hypothetical protein
MEKGLAPPLPFRVLLVIVRRFSKAASSSFPRGVERVLLIATDVLSERDIR